MPDMKRQLNAVSKSKLAEYRVQVVLDGLHGDPQAAPDLSIRIPAGY
jgi:hypothetical protein